MVTQSDGVFVAAPAWHEYMEKALNYLHIPNKWYSPPPDVVTAQPGLDGVYFLPGTSWSTPVPPLPPGAVSSNYSYGGSGAGGGGGHKKH